MNLLRPATLNLVLLQSPNPQSTVPSTALPAHSMVLGPGNSGLHSAAHAIGQKAAASWPKAIPSLPSQPDHFAEAVGEMCRLLVPCALSPQGRNPEQLATLGEYFGNILRGDPDSLEGIVSHADTTTEVTKQASPSIPAAKPDSATIYTTPVTAALRLVRGLIRSAELHSAGNPLERSNRIAPNTPKLKTLLSQLDSNCVSLLKSLFAECLTLNKRGLNFELRPLLEALEQEAAQRGSP